jgi:tight adherence protein C
MLPDRRKAFANFGNRSGVEGLQRLAAMLGQALQYGTPLSQALRGVANELRHERMNKLEEKAVRLPALLIFPLIFFIMPSLYIVLLGTSFLQLYDALSTFTSTLPTHN